MHVDFQEVDLTQEIEAPIALMLVGSAVGVREGGVLDQTAARGHRERPAGRAAGPPRG